MVVVVVVVVVVLLLVSPPGEALSSRSDCKLAIESWADEQQRLLHLQQEAAEARRSQLEPGLLYFLHVPRTGGRTFYQCLLRNLYPKEHRCPHSYDKLRVDPKHPDCKLLTTHDDYSILTKLSRETTSVVTNLRHPLNRVLSTYEFSIEVAARFLRTATNESSNGVESRDSQEKSSETSHVSTLDIWPWKYLVPFMRDDLLKRRGARNAKMMDTPQDIQNSYNVSSIAMPLDEFIQRREAFELMHNGLTFQVAGLTNTSSLEEAKELRLCIQQYPELGIHALQVAKLCLVRDLKAENLLLGSDGQWKLCDFGSISTNHKRFEKAAEMGVEEDIIRKHTTPAYRAPEMWDLYRREIISEKVDIWALGCLLYRMAYLKSAFDGESKLQILNGNYRLPDLPKYSANITGLIKDMLNSSPEARPDAMQVWHRVNSSLPSECQKIGPDKAPSTLPSQDNAGNAVQGRQPSVMPTRAPPPPPQRNSERGSPNSIQKESDQNSASSVGKGGALGSFWSTQYAQEAHYDDDNNPPARNKSVGMANQLGSLSKSPPLQGTQGANSLFCEPQSTRNDLSKKRGITARKYSGSNSGEGDGGDARLDDYNGDDHDVHNKGGSGIGVSKKVPHGESVNPTTDEAFNEFAAEFQKASNITAEIKDTGRESWQMELENLRKELKQAQKEKLEIASKYEKLTAICRSQRLEIQELKSALAATNNQSATFQVKEPVSQGRPLSSLSSQKPEQQVGTIWDLQEGLSSPGNFSSEPQGWRAFSDATSHQVLNGKKHLHQDFSSVSDTFGSASFDVSRSEVSKMGATSENSQTKATRFAGDVWGLHDSFAVLGAGFTATKGVGQGSQGEGVISSANAYDANSSKGTSRPANHSQPSGWAGF